MTRDESGLPEGADKPYRALSFQKRTNVLQVSSVNHGCVNQAASAPEVAQINEKHEGFYLQGVEDNYFAPKLQPDVRDFTQKPMDCDNITSVRVYSYITLICLTIAVEARRSRTQCATNASQYQYMNVAVLHVSGIWPVMESRRLP